MRIRIFTTLLLAVLAGQLLAQCSGRYKDMVFSAVTKTPDITYSTANGTTLKMDIYEPTGDVETNRPLIILAHGGSFISGNKSNDNVVTQLCTNFAKRGYVTASIDYRLGSFLDMLDSAKAIDVVMKAISDGKAAIRWFRKDVANGNTYKINPDMILVGGNSAGAVLYMHQIYIDSVNECPPNLRTIINNNGGIEGNSGNPGYSSESQGIINCAGGLNVPEFVGPGSKPSANFHGTNDDVVPYNCANAQSNATPVRLCGLGAIEPLYQQYNVQHVSVLFPGDGHVPWQGDAAKFTKVDTTAANFFYTMACTAGTTGISEMVADNDVKVFPSPASNLVNISLKNMNNYTFVQLVDGTGKVVEEQAVTSAQVSFNRNNLPAGVYVVKLLHSDATVSVKRFIFE